MSQQLERKLRHHFRKEVKNFIKPKPWWVPKWAYRWLLGKFVRLN